MPGDRASSRVRPLRALPRSGGRAHPDTRRDDATTRASGSCSHPRAIRPRRCAPANRSAASTRPRLSRAHSCSTPARSSSTARSSPTAAAPSRSWRRGRRSVLPGTARTTPRPRSPCPASTTVVTSQPKPHMIPRYSLPEIAELFTDEARFGAWLDVEVLAVEAQAKLGVVPGADAKVVRERAGFDVAAIHEREKSTDHDVAAFVDVVQAHIAAPAGGVGSLWADVERRRRHRARAPDDRAPSTASRPPPPISNRRSPAVPTSSATRRWWGARTASMRSRRRSA